jgi:hypothetical protein
MYPIMAWFIATTLLLSFIIHTIETPLIRTPVIRIVNFPDRLDPSGKFFENSTKLTRLEINGYRIKYSSDMASRTSNQAWSKGLDADTFYK